MRNEAARAERIVSIHLAVGDDEEHRLASADHVAHVVSIHLAVGDDEEPSQLRSQRRP